jgi:signal transduction histidine kinase
MNAIMGFADLLGYPDISPAERNNFISIIQNSGNRLLNIIDAIIEISKIEAGQVTPKLRTINLDLFIDNLFNSLVYKISKDKLIELKKIRPDSLTGLNITTDEVKLKQIFTNLINNSIKFTEKGFIAFGYELKSENEIAFIVRDSGVGIDKSDLEFIFERFRRVEGNQAIIKGGPGLGLSISKAYVEMLGGNIFVDSEIGKGAAFTFVLPIERPSMQ